MCAVAPRRRIDVALHGTWRFRRLRQRWGGVIGGSGDPEVARPSGPPGRGLVKGHEELRLAVAERPGPGPLGQQLTPADTVSAATENCSGRLVQRYVPPHGPGYPNALLGRGIVP